MKTFNLTNVIRTCLIILFVASLMSSCGGQNTVYVCSMKDIIGLWILGIMSVIIMLVFLYAWVADKIKRN